MPSAGNNSPHKTHYSLFSLNTCVMLPGLYFLFFFRFYLWFVHLACNLSSDQIMVEFDQNMVDLSHLKNKQKIPSESKFEMV